MKKSMETDSHCDVLKMKTNVVKQVKELTAPFQPDLLKPCTKADLQYSGSADTLADCQNYGQLSGPNLPHPSKCHVTGNGLEAANVDEKLTAILHVVNYKGEPCVQPISSLECELVSEIAGTRVLGRVERIEQSKYEISYPAHHQGEAPPSHQSGRPAHQGESIQCGSEVIHPETWCSHPLYQGSEWALWCGT